MERIVLLILILMTWVVIILFGHLIPWASALAVLFAIMVGYMIMVTIAMVHQKRKQKKKPQEMDTSYQPKVTVLIPAHNEEFVIEGTVKTLMNLDYPDFEVLVIDDRSGDATAQKLAELAEYYKDDKRYRYHLRSPESLPGKSAVLNEALTLSDGEVIAVFDADAWVEKEFLKEIVPFLADERTGGVQARKIMANFKHNLLTRCQNFEYSMDSYFQCGRDTIRGAVEFRGNGQLVKRAAIESVGGWNDYTLTDDLDLSTRFHIAGWDIRFAHKVFVFEEAIVRFMPLLRQRRRWAEGSLTRYLEYAAETFFSDKTSLRAKADLIAYIVEFLFPLWLMSDFVYLGLLAWFGDAPTGHLVSSFLLLPFLSVFFYTMLLIAIIRFNRPTLFKAVIGAMMTSIYLLWVWVPVSIWVIWKILFQKQRSMNWGKTEHLGAVSAK